VVGFRAGGQQLAAFNQLPISEVVKEKKEFPTNIDVFNELRNGRIDACVLDEGIARYLIRNR